MNYLLWFMRAKRWVQNPPSEGRVKLVFGVIAICLVIVGIERFVGWPDWMTVDNLRQKP
ncbi:MAG: hypothetical protein ACKO1H_16205 [Tabrizicola sp.]